MMPKRFTQGALAPALRPVLAWLAAATLAAVLSALALLAALWALVQFVADLGIGWVITALGLWVVGASMASLASWLSHRAEADFAARLRRQLASHLVRLPASTLARQGSDALRRLVSDDIAALHHMTAHLPSEIAIFAIVPPASIALLLAMAGPAALWALLPGVLAALYYLVWMPRVSARHGAERMRVMGDITTAVDDYARGIRIHRLYGVQSGALAAYHDAAGRFTRGMVAWVGKVATPAAVAVALLQAAATFAIAYAVTGAHDAAALAAALFFSLAIVTPALRLGHGLDYVAAGRAAAGRLAALLQEPALPAGAAPLPEGAPELTVKDAVLAVDGRRLLDGLQHRFAPGTLTAVTGPSGAGKTTLLRVLAGLEPLDEGAILLAGTDIAALGAQARQSACLFIPQGGDVLPATVRENLALSAPDACDECMVEALARARIDVSLEADAMRLSGGERQRVGLARAFLAPAPVILIDEPTSALDDATATRLVMALRVLTHERGLTLVMVTHDLALAACADVRLDLKPAMQPEVQP
ncbi:ABC transporter ATP-binding protein [Comamonas testosteroni]|uniref:ABC transporter related n=1 Tax=Comamonas testosteroni (strain DSM 14576 / KF-1) TaxID=399795 RepID=B7WVU7_COMTK|nr:ABC transporter ATP-binding protein [Comamonas testosteroni]EED67719.1 ABC transporter related [Comamonas testosteroni KF-1]WQG65854.1 ABC transporter ATP-binding protein [Comamonas testosteroni]